MKSITHYTFKPKSAIRRSLWMGLLFCWLSFGYAALVHQSKHDLADHQRCEFCLSSALNTPFIHISELVIAPTAFTFQRISSFQSIEKSFSPVISHNRDPPVYIIS